MAWSEILCTDIKSVERAVAIGTDRIELCAALEVGGVTPGPGLQRLAIECAAAAPEPVDVVVLVRPRRGDFVLDGPRDLDVLAAEIQTARELGAAGVAVGVLGADGRVDVDAMRTLLDVAGPLSVTFHRAVDHTPDLEASVGTLIELGIGRVLTSGRAPTAWQGREALSALVGRFGDGIEVIAGGGVSGVNARALLQVTGVHALHGSCSREVLTAPSGAPRTNLGKPGAPSESSRLTLDDSSARALVAAAREAPTRPAASRGVVPGAFGDSTPSRTLAASDERGLAVEVHATDRDASAAVARELAERIESNPRCTLGLATGSTMLGVYAQLASLVRERGLDCSAVTTFNLDEYAGVQPSDPNSFRAFMASHLFRPAGFDPARCHFPDAEGGPESIAHAAEAYESAIREAGGLDLQLLGIGRNGHIAFNEPGSEADSRTRAVELDDVTRRDAASAFGGLDRVPTHAVTMGVATILEARAIRLLAFGEHKADAVRRTLEDEPSSLVPSTWVRGHADACMHLDQAAAGALMGAPRRV